MKWLKIFAFNLLIAVILHFSVYLLVEYTYCTQDLNYLLQPFYPVYAIKPFSCEYKQVEPILGQVQERGVVNVYFFFREYYVENYKNRIPPFAYIIVKKDEYGSFKSSDYQEVYYELLTITSRLPAGTVLAEKTGDCDDYSTALYILYKLLGYDAELMLVKIKNKILGYSLQHEVVIVKESGKYYLIDTVNDFFVITDDSAPLLKEYERELMYYDIVYYWIFNDSVLPTKRI